MGAAVTTTPTSPPPTPELHDSPTVVIATLFAARRSGDRVLERLMRRRLLALGIQVRITPTVTTSKRVSRG